MSWYITAIRNYVNFSGRARRKEYWMFALFNYLIVIVLSVADSLIGLKIPMLLIDNIGVLSSLYGLFIFIPSLSLLFRRLHDIDKSAWWLLISLIPVIGWIWILILTTLSGTVGSNRYGIDPKV